MRSVPSHCKPLALAIQVILVRLISYIPSPIIFGYFIDRSCLRWTSTHLETGEEIGACLFYDLDLFHLTYISLGCTMHVMSCVFAWMNYVRMRKDPIFNQQLYADSREGALERKLSVGVALQPMRGSIMRLHSRQVHVSIVVA